MYGWKCVAVSPAMSLTAIIPATVAIRLLHVYGAHTNPRLHFNSLGNWERDATCHHYVWIHKKILPLLQFALTASRFPQGGGIMELVWPYKYLLSLKFVYLAIYLPTLFPEKEEGGSVLEPLQRPTSGSGRWSYLASFYSQYRETDSSKEEESDAWNEDLFLFPEFGFPTVGLYSVNMHLKTVTKLYAQKFLSSTPTINFSLADITILGTMVLWMQKVKGRGAGGLAHFTSAGLAEGRPEISIRKKPSDSAYQEDVELVPSFSKWQLQHFLQEQQKYSVPGDMVTSTK